MSEPTPPDGHQPAEPPRIPERSSDGYASGSGVGDAADDTPQRPARPTGDPHEDGATLQRRAVTEPANPAADSTMVFAPGADGPAAPPPGQQPPGQYPPSQYPPTQQPGGPPPPGAPGPAAGAAGFPPGQPPGPPGYGGPPPGPADGGGTGQPPGDRNQKLSGLLVAGLIALVVALVGALVFVVTQGDDDAEPVTTEEAPVETAPETTEPVEAEPTPPPTEVPPATGSVDGVFVHIEALGEVIADDDLQASLERIGLAEGDNPVSTTDPVLNLCAAVPVDEPVSAAVEWTLDSVTISEGAARTFTVPADGNCINNNGSPLANGSYEVSFTDDAGGLSSIALFTVGAATRTQLFLNDTGGDLCTVDVGPTSASFYQPFELTSGEPLVTGDSIIIDIADVEHEARGIDCNGQTLDPVVFLPSDDPVSLSTGEILPATTTTTTTTPPPQITDDEVAAIDGAVGSLDTAISPGSDEEAAVFEVLRGADAEFPIARPDPAVTLCAAWNVPGPLEAEVVWEFNRVEIARVAVTAVDGAIGNCIPPAGAQFDEGAYQVYLQRGDFISQVETYTAGRIQTQLAFRNDTGVAICRVGFSPNLTNWYTFYPFAESSDFESALEPGEAFTIVAPFIENDIQARDCDNNVVAESFDIPPTDETLNLSTGRP